MYMYKYTPLHLFKVFVRYVLVPREGVRVCEGGVDLDGAVEKLNGRFELALCVCVCVCVCVCARVCIVVCVYIYVYIITYSILNIMNHIIMYWMARWNNLMVASNSRCVCVRVCVYIIAYVYRYTYISLLILYRIQ